VIIVVECYTMMRVLHRPFNATRDGMVEMPTRGEVENRHGCMTRHRQYRYFNTLDTPLPIMKYVIVTGWVMSGLKRDKIIAER